MSVKIIQSEYDKREYKYIYLDNGLDVLLVSDKEADKSGAAIDVKVGQLSDFDDSFGIAHFLEHMLFLGTEKYPNQDEYRTYLSQNSGSSNAYTAHMNTNYYFECANNAFPKALDIFAQFFLSPKFTESLAEREMKAVHSEFQKNINNDAWRRHQLMKSTAKKGNAYSKFGIGSMETLSKPDIRDILINFYNKFYSSNLMKAVVYGKEDIAVLETMAREAFSGVRRLEGVNTPIFKDHPFDESNMGTMLDIVPINDKDKLSFFWVIEDLHPHYRSNPAKYLSHLFGHEGPNSLLSLLIKEGLVRELESSHHDEMNLFSYFEVSVELTRKGFERYLDVVNYIFAYLDMLKKQEPQEWIFDEIRQIDKIRRLFRDRASAINEVSKFATRLNTYAPEDVLIVDDLMEDFQADQIKRVVDSLTLKNLRIMRYSKKFEGKTTEEEPWFKIKYSTTPLPAEIKDLYTNFKLKEDDVIGLPPPNKFIPRDLSVLPGDPAKLPEVPHKIYEDDQAVIYYKQDTLFKKPKAYVRLSIFSDPVNANNLERENLYIHLG